MSMTVYKPNSISKSLVKEEIKRLETKILRIYVRELAKLLRIAGLGYITMILSDSPLAYTVLGIMACAILQLGVEMGKNEPIINRLDCKILRLREQLEL